MLRGVSRFFGSVTLGFGVLVLFSFLFLGQLDKQFDNVDVVFDDAVEEFLEENEEEVLEALLEEEPQLEALLEQCESGEIPAENCEIDVDNPLVEDALPELEEEFVEELGGELEEYRIYDDISFFGFTVAFVLIILGLALIFFGVEYDPRKFAEKVSSKLFFTFLLLLIGAWFFLRLTEEDIAAFVGGLISGVPDILLLFVSNLLLSLSGPVFEIFFIWLLVLTIGSLVVWLVLFFDVWGRFVSKKKV